MFDFDLQSREHARQTHTILMRAHHEAGNAASQSFDRGRYYRDVDLKEPTEPRTKYQDQELVEFERMTNSALKMVTEQAKKKFGNNARHPECDYCLTVSVFGGPSHENSSLCRSGKRPHCTCSACF